MFRVCVCLCVSLRVSLWHYAIPEVRSVETTLRLGLSESDRSKNGQRALAGLRLRDADE